MICIPITATNMEDALKDRDAASKIADIVELRLDYIKDPNLERLLKGCTKPVIVTNRPVREGGRFGGREKDRVSFLKLAIELHADYIDIEHDSRDMIHNVPADKTQIIVSCHNFSETPDNLYEIYQRLRQGNADIVKIITYAKDITDNIKVYQLLQQVTSPVISFCMGENGIISRILYKKFGSYLTFASLQAGKESAPGQISVHELFNTYQVQRQDSGMSVYGLIGNPVSHSISPVIHNTLFQEMGFNSIYVPFRVERIDDFIREFKRLPVEGYSVTIPHKESVLHYLDEIDPMAKKLGAVNTIVNRNGRLLGFNTDCEAALKTLERVNQVSGMNSLSGKKIILLGAGGAARSIAFGLKERGAHITIFNRNYERARLLADEVGCSSREMHDLSATGADIIINATPVGMFPAVDESPVDKSMLRPHMIVFDTIYNPVETKLLRDARDCGCKTVGGLMMFIHQAAAQYKLWTGHMPSLELIEKTAYRRLTGRE
ncbi:MAG: shikimate dehydrogenase [wastewater metagenome]|nr:shikimate dehydrogenase [Candidatus Loosdrechtia aerotolerans]